MKQEVTTPPVAEGDAQVCKCCGRMLPIENFVRTKYGRLKTCSECRGEKARHTRLSAKASEAEELLKQIADVRHLRLKDFQARELIIELRGRGYKGTLTYTEEHVIDIAKVD